MRVSGEEGAVLVPVLEFAVGDVEAGVVFEPVGISGEVGKEVVVIGAVELAAAVETGPGLRASIRAAVQVEQSSPASPVGDGVGEQTIDSSRAPATEKKVFRCSSPRSRSSFNCNRSLLCAAYSAGFSSTIPRS